MITGIHAVIFTTDAEESRAFFRDVLEFPCVDAGDGWLIFALPAAELAAHPADEDGRHELYLMCDDIHATVEELKAKGVEFTQSVSDEGFGLTGALDPDFDGVEKPLPPREELEQEENLDGLSEEQLETFWRRAVPEPRVPQSGQRPAGRTSVAERNYLLTRAARLAAGGTSGRGPGVEAAKGVWMRGVLIGVVLLALAGATGCSGSDESTPADRAVPPSSHAGAGGRIAFSDDVKDIYVINADGSGLARLTSNPANDFDPAWSPDGKRVAFRSERDGNNEIYVMNVDGSAARNVSRYSGDDWGPAWTPDGRIGFNSNRDGPDLHLYVVRPDGSAVERIGGKVWVEYPAWSPDGSRIAFMAQTWENGDNYEIYVMNADGSGVRRLTNAPGSDGHPAWAPDGARIAFNAARDSPDDNALGHRIYLMNADGSRQRRLTRVFGKYPDWSPDGRRIVFSGDRLYIVNADGSGLTPLPTRGVRLPVLPDWTR